MIWNKIKTWMDGESNPSKKQVLKNLDQILHLIEEGSPYIAGQRIRFLISDIKNNKYT